MKLSGWGNFPTTEASEFAPRSEADALAYLNGHSAQAPLIPRGLGRSYGDSSLSANVMSSRHLDQFIAFDPSTGRLRCAAGVSLASLLEVFVPKGWFPAATPGTKFVTIGGAIASDVHGKNHHTDGSFCDHVNSIALLTAQGLVECSRETHSDLFYATCGGMGLTGFIVEASLTLKKIVSSDIEETTIRCKNIWETLETFDQNQSSPYSVAWVDCLSKGSSLGRSIVSLGRHAQSGELNVNTRRKIPMPINLPGFILNTRSIRAFNFLHYHRAPRETSYGTRHYEGYFYPLDSIDNWNRMYGKNGFMQYQVALPYRDGKEILETLLNTIAASGLGSFLAVLKTLGPENKGLLSFPLEGYTLALDFKFSIAALKLLAELDNLIVAANGRLYLTKDSRMSEQTFKTSYPRWEEFQEIRVRYGADKVFNSLQSKRLGL